MSEDGVSRRGFITGVVAALGLGAVVGRASAPSQTSETPLTPKPTQELAPTPTVEARPTFAPPTPTAQPLPIHPTEIPVPINATDFLKEKDVRTLRLPAIVGVMYQEPLDKNGRPTAPDVAFRDSKKRVPGEEISLMEITSPDGASHRVATAITNQDGVYVFEGVKPANYEIMVGRFVQNMDTSPYKGYYVFGANKIQIEANSGLKMGTVYGQMYQASRIP